MRIDNSLALFTRKRYYFFLARNKFVCPRNDPVMVCLFGHVFMTCLPMLAMPPWHSLSNNIPYRAGTMGRHFRYTLRVMQTENE